MALLLMLRWPGASWLLVDFQDLLPASTSDYWQRLAIEKSSTAYERQLVMMAAGPSAERFLESATQQLVVAGYAETNFAARQAKLWQGVTAALTPYARGLIAPSDKQQLGSDPANYLSSFRNLLYSPLGGSWLSGLQTDPLGLFQGFMLANMPIPAVEADLSVAYLQVPSSKLGFNEIAGLYEHFEMLSKSAEEEGILFHATGSPLYSAFGVKSGEEEVSSIGAVSLLALALLLWITTRNPAGLLLTAVVVMSGIVGGISVTLILLQKVHLLALVFGATLIGISADYALHYLCHASRPDCDIAPVLRGLKLSVSSSVLSFLILVFLPFPGLQQIGLFMAAGLVCSFLTVLLLFPSLLRPKHSYAPVLALLQRAAQASSASSFPLLILLVLLLLPGLFLLQPQDDVRDFYAEPPRLEAGRKAISDMGQVSEDSHFLLLNAGDEESLLKLEERLLRDIPGLRAGITALVPSQASQLESLRLQQIVFARTEVRSFLREIGFDDSAIQSFREGLAKPYEPLKPSALDQLSLPMGSGGFLGCRGGQCASWLALDSTVSAVALKTALTAESDIRLVSPISDINATLASYRSRTALVLMSAAILVTVILGLTLGWRPAVRIVVQPLLACLLSLALLGYTVGNYSVVNLLALMIVAGMGLDFAIFRHVTSAQTIGTTGLAVTLSATTSVLAFGMLSLSETPVIRDFGISIGAGLFFAWLLFWLQDTAVGTGNT